MKIIRKGVLPEDIIFTGECTRCHCLLECNYNDTCKRNLGDRYSGEFIEHSVICPTERCGRKIVLTEKSTPDEISAKLRELSGWKRTDPWLPSV